MVESIAATTSIILLRQPLHGASASKDRRRRRFPESCQLPSGSALFGQPSVLHKNGKKAADRRYRRVASTTIRVQAAELTKEAYRSREDERTRWDTKNLSGSPGLAPKLWPPSNRADCPALHNPLLRLHRMGCGWLGVIFEWEGVIVEDDPELERQVWLTLAQEEGKSPPPAFLLNRIEGMKNEQAISEVLCWSRDPSELRRLAARKEDIHRSLHGGYYQLRPGSWEFMSMLVNHNIPIGLASTRPKKNLVEAMEAVGVQGTFEAVVTAEDVHRGKPDPEMFMYASQLLKFIPERCIVFGSSNSTVEAAHDAGMKCVAVASKHPHYELGAADLVVRELAQLSIVDLKTLVAAETPELEMELEEEEDPFPSTTVASDDFYE